MKESISSEEVKNFGFDSEGKPLRYKIIVKNGHVNSILYNTGNNIEELKFEELLYTKGEYGTII